MPNFSNYYKSQNWDYSPAFKTITISTKRAPAMDANDIISDPVTHLTGVESSPRILANRQIQQVLMQAAGLDGTQTQLWELRIRKGAHVDDGVSVNQLPDIQVHDHVVIDNVVYSVKWADITHPFAFGDILLVYITEDIS